MSPKDVTEPLIKSGDAELTEEQPAAMELAATEPKYPGPWSDEEWWDGISLGAWAEWRDPEACAQKDVECDTSEKTLRLRSEAIKRLHELLKADMKGGLVVLGLPGDPPEGTTRPVSKDTIIDVVKRLEFYAEFYDFVYFGSSYFEVRLYQADRFAAAQEAKPAGFTKDPRGRKPVFDHDEAHREAVRFLAKTDGLPRAQAELEKHILNWLAESDIHPSTSTVRGFVSKKFGFLWVRPNS